MINEFVADSIETMAKPFAIAFGMDCIDPQTQQLKPESDCARRKRMIEEGRYADAMYDIFWPSKPEQKE